MANHLRKQIRDAAVTALTGLATTGAHVFSGRISPLKDSELPGLIVYLNGDDGVPDALMGGPTTVRNGQLRVEAVGQGNDALIDTLDQMAVEIETAMFGAAGASLRALLMVPPDPPSAQIVMDEPDAGGVRRTGSMVISFPIAYRTPLGDPTTRV